MPVTADRLHRLRKIPSAASRTAGQRWKESPPSRFWPAQGIASPGMACPTRPDCCTSPSAPGKATPRILCRVRVFARRASRACSSPPRPWRRWLSRIGNLRMSQADMQGVAECRLALDQLRQPETNAMRVPSPAGNKSGSATRCDPSLSDFQATTKMTLLALLLGNVAAPA